MIVPSSPSHIQSISKYSYHPFAYTKNLSTLESPATMLLQAMIHPGWDYGKTYWLLPQPSSLQSVLSTALRTMLKRPDHFSSLMKPFKLQLHPGDLTMPYSDLLGSQGWPSPYLWYIPVVSLAYSSLLTLATSLLLGQDKHSPIFRLMDLLFPLPGKLSSKICSVP